MTIASAQARKTAIISVLGASILFSTSATSRALFDFPGTSISVGAWRVFIGGLGLVAYATWRYGTAGLKTLVRLPTIWVMGISVLSYQVAFFIGAGRIGVAMGTLGALASAPFFAGIIGWFAGTGRPTKVWYLSTALGVTGLALITGVSEVNDAWGFVAVFFSGVMYAIYTVFGVRLTRSHNVSGAEVLATSFGIGAVLSLPIVIMTSAWVNSAANVGLVLYLGLATTTVAYVLFGNGLTHLSPGTVSTLTLLEPVMATILGVFILGEPMSLRGWIGCATIIAALAILGIVESRVVTGEIGEALDA